MSAASLPKTHQVWQQIARGIPSNAIALVKDAPLPVPTKEDVLVKVRNVAWNPVGYKTMGMVPGIARALPAILEFDLSGVVADANGHPQFSNGQEVFGITPADVQIKTGRGAMAQYVLVKAENLTPKPPSVPFDQAAGLPLAGLTAYGALFEKGGLGKKSGERVFINGGSTAVGRLAIQLAKSRGIHVVTTCSSSSKEGVAKLGPDEIIDYHENPIPQHLIAHYPAEPASSDETKGFHLIIDCVGNQPELYTSCPYYLLPDCPFLTLNPQPPSVGSSISLYTSIVRPKILGGVPRDFIIFFMSPSNEALVELGKLAEAGKLVVDIDGGKARGWEREDVLEGYERMMSGKAQGKIVLEVPQ